MNEKKETVENIETEGSNYRLLLEWQVEVCRTD